MSLVAALAPLQTQILADILQGGKIRMDGQVVSVLGTLVGTLGGALITTFAQRDQKKIGELERRVERYKNEIRARQAEEASAAKWLHELGAANSPLAAKRQLRTRTEFETGLRPSIGPREVTPNP